MTKKAIRRAKDLSLYIHIPFCKTICVYCGFLTFANKGNLIDDYFSALEKEMIAKAATFRDFRVVSVYFGGGTPSLPEAANIVKILKKVRQNFRLAVNPEITVECNPESATAEKLRTFKGAGVNRISLGIQSFCGKTLWRVARPHGEEEIFKALKNIKRSGIRNFGADFIIGLPYQTSRSFKEELETILAYKPPHLSYYFLSPDTPKIDLIKDDCPAEEEQVKMYRHLTKTLSKKGYLHYEVSNFALPGCECRHNLRYWKQEEYLGLGLGAHSYYGRRCHENEKDFEKYLQDPCRTDDVFELDDELKRMDFLMLHLRTHNGIDLGRYEETGGDKKRLLAQARAHLKNGYLKSDGKTLAATEAGFLFLDTITRDLL